jgi:hypothetical protein
MSIPGVTMRFADGGLGIIPPGPGGAQGVVGVSLSGTPLTVYPAANGNAVVAALGGGPLAEAAAAVCDVTGTPVYAVPCTIVTAGSVTATFTQVGTGAGVVSATCAPHVEIKAKCTTAGSLGTAAFAFAINGGAYGTPVVSTSTSWPYRVPGTFCTLTFATGSYRQNDVYTIPTTGVVSASNPAGGPDSITQVSSPVDAYAIRVTVTTGGATRAVCQFTYALDVDAAGESGNTSPAITMAATYVIPGTGIKLAFTEAVYVAGDTYSGTAVPPATDNTAIGLAIDALIASRFAFEFIHVVGTTATSAANATLASAVDSKMTTAEANYRYLATLIECPQSETDATISAALASFASSHGRVWICCGDDYMVSTLSGLILKRNGAWTTCARLAGCKLSENPGKVKLGPLPNVQAIVRDEAATPGLTDARLITLRTFQDRAGYFITDGPTMANSTSDYSSVMNVRVVNRAATIAASAFTDYVNDDVRIDKTTGFIDERDAQSIDNMVTSKLQAALQGTPGGALDECSAVSAAVSRSDNLLSSPIATAVVTITPKGYFRGIAVTIGFRNPRVG